MREDEKIEIERPETRQNYDLDTRRAKDLITLVVRL